MPQKDTGGVPWMAQETAEMCFGGLACWDDLRAGIACPLGVCVPHVRVMPMRRRRLRGHPRSCSKLVDHKRTSPKGINPKAIAFHMYAPHCISTRHRHNAGALQ